jgi:endonuclease
MRGDYQAWLISQEYSGGTVVAQLQRVGKVESAYGSLDDHIKAGTLDQIIRDLNYSTADERQGRANPSKLIFQGNVRNNLQSYKNAVVRYRKFVTGWTRADAPEPTSLEAPNSVDLMESENFDKRAFSLERDMQRAIRDNLKSLSSSYRIADDGAERSVQSGFIDITCEDDADGSLVVIELKAGKADGRAVAQILGYMGDLSEEEDPRIIKGCLIAHGFDQRARSAARMVPSLKLIRYSIKFDFQPDQA